MITIVSDKREHKEQEDDFIERSPEANGEEKVQEQNDSERDKASDTCEEIKTLSIWEKIKRDAERKTCRNQSCNCKSCKYETYATPGICGMQGAVHYVRCNSQNKECIGHI